LASVYEIYCKTNDTSYIGRASDVTSRFAVHRSNLNNNKHHNRHLQHAWNKYGEDAFDFRVLISDINDDFIGAKEIEYIEEYIKSSRRIFNTKFVEAGRKNSKYIRKLHPRACPRCGKKLPNDLQAAKAILNGECYYCMIETIGEMKATGSSYQADRYINIVTK